MLTRIATSVPGLTKVLLRAYYQMAKPGAHGHPLAKSLCDALDYRIPAEGQLPWGDRVVVAMNDVIGADILANGCYEPETVELLSRYLGPGMVVCDVGGHVGQYTLLASSRVGASGAVHTFEPSEITFQWLSRNVELNQRRNVTLNRLALSDRSGTVQYYHAPAKNPGAGSLIDAAEPRHLKASTVDVSTFDEYVTAKGLTQLDLIKVDVEGAEFRFLEGAAASLRRFEPLILIEFSVRLHGDGHSYADLADRLRSHGCELYLVGELPCRPFRLDVSERFFNVLAVPPSRVAALTRAGILA